VKVNVMSSRKVVINDCFGGFPLSPEAVLRYGEIIGKDIYIYKSLRFNGVSSGERGFQKIALEEAESGILVMYTLRDHGGRFDLPDDQAEWFDDREIERDDPALVRVVEEMGGKANGMCADLEVVEIPGDVEWEIDEYDGLEHVAEAHRTWG
jgi:hypothetical protein